MAETPRIELCGITKTFQSGGAPLTVLEEVDLQIAAGESIAILGPSGSGKSTLLALIAGLDRPDSGAVILDGQPIHELSENELALLRRHQIGFVFQSFQLLTNMTARENVRLPLELLEAERAESRTDELLEIVGLAERGHHYPSQLSGGEQQRVALARAFASDPPILLADEPTGNLDRRTGHMVLETLDRLHRKSGTTLVLVTHDEAAARLADRSLELQDGKLIRADDRTHDFLDTSR